MKVNDVIDIDGKLYKVVCIGESGSFGAELIGEITAKGFIKRQQNDYELMDKLHTFCKNQTSCNGCLLEFYHSCTFEEYDSELLNEAYSIIKESKNESTD